MINNLLACGLLAETADGALLPRVDMGRMALAELLNRVDARSVVHRQGGGVHERARDLAEQLAQARTAVLGELTLNEWLETGN